MEKGGAHAPVAPPLGYGLEPEGDIINSGDGKIMSGNRSRTQRKTENVY